MEDLTKNHLIAIGMICLTVIVVTLIVRLTS